MGCGSDSHRCTGWNWADRWAVCEEVVTGSWIFRRLLVPVIALASVACAAPSPSTLETDPPERARPARAQDLGQPFRLVFELPSTSWRAGDSVEGQATLELLEGDSAVFSGSGGGPLGFEFVEIDGRRRMSPVWTGDCAVHQLDAASPLVSPITKSGGFSADDPDAQFYRDFFDRPDVQLTPGEWEISAVAVFREGHGCTGREHMLRASIRVDISP
ncbi:hypothetical protein BH24CHL6_BH24CHL6_06510 [soil metagenome]